MKKPNIIDYVNIVHHSGGPSTTESINYFNQHKNDAKFVRRAIIFNQLFNLRINLGI